MASSLASLHFGLRYADQSLLLAGSLAIRYGTPCGKCGARHITAVDFSASIIGVEDVTLDIDRARRHYRRRDYHVFLASLVLT